MEQISTDGPEIAPYLDTFHAEQGSQQQLPVIDETREKKPVKTNSIIVKNGGNEQMAQYALVDAMTTE